MKKRIFTLLLFVCCGYISTWAQSAADIEIAKTALAQQADKFGLTAEDVLDFSVSSAHVSSYHNAVHVYLQQTVDGVPVKNGLITIGIKDNEVYNIQSNAVPNIYDKLLPGSAALSAEEAIRSAATALGYRSVEFFEQVEEKGRNNFIYAPTSFSDRDIPVYLCYDKNEEGTYELSWNVDLDVPGDDYLSLRMSAVDGTLVSKNNYTTKYDLRRFARPSAQNNAVQQNNAQRPNSQRSSLMGSYRVYAAPTQSPNDGPHELVADPAIMAASPFGWHDTDGMEGAEFTTTQGNNVYTFLDADGDDIPDEPEPDGGVDLIFDFAHDTTAEPDSNRKAAQVNLFYFSNYMHDLSYIYGFDEAAGNFQFNNYGNGGEEGDYVITQTANLGTENNVTYVAGADGASPSISMGLWGASPNDLLNVSAPSQLEGLYDANPANFGAPITDDPVTGNIVIIDDGSPAPTEGCEATVNGDQIMGNIAMIDRGSCEFGLKCLNAQNAGAIGVIVCNIAGVNGGDGSETIVMGGGANGGEVTIPAVMVNLPNCNLIKASINSDIPVTATIQQPQIDGPENLNSSFENGLIAYMYTLGIADRLTGGAEDVACLDNAEAMSVGWGDFFALATTAKATDDGALPRGIAAYVNGQDVDGRGIRAFPYSTDMDIAPRTHADANNASAFVIGEIWASTLWDMYWGMVDEYGFDEDPTNLESGNARAMRLVIEGMKEQPCSPSLVDGRDGILAADAAIYNGDNFCIIYGAFARRGLGFNADAGDSNSTTDNVEDFLVHPDCLDELLISKTATPIVSGGQEILVQIEVTNYKKDPVTDMTVTDVIPTGATFVDGSGNYTSTISGDEVTFDVGAVAENDVITVTYRILADESLASTTLHFDDFSDGTSTWDIELTAGTSTFWQPTDTITGTPDGFAFYIKDTDMEQVDISLISNDFYSISGDRPALRFDNRYNLERGSDGGFVMVQEEGQEGWERLTFDNNIRNGYPFTLVYGGAYAIPNLAAFTGDSEGFVDTYLDLSAYAGKNIKFRYRYGNDDNTLAEGPFTGWAIDNFEIMDLIELRSEACATAGGDTPACASASTLIESADLTSTDELNANSFAMELLPNPADQFVNISIQSKAYGEANLRLVTIDGKTVKSEDVLLNEGTNVLEMNVAGLPAGMYFVELISETQSDVQKLSVK